MSIDTSPIQVSATVDADKTMCFETGLLASQANGAVVATLGKTQVLVTATSAESVKEGTDFFPLTVDIEERMYAAGKIPGSFFRREARAGETAILTCRLVDRSLRPSFPKDFRNEVHIVGTVLGADLQNPYDIIAINAASVALGISDIPFNGPIGAVRLAFSAEGNWIVHPTYEEIEECTFELVVAGRVLPDDSEVAIMMVEAASNLNTSKMHIEGAAKLDETGLVEGLNVSKEHITTAVDLQRQLMAAAGVKIPFEYEPQSDYTDDTYSMVEQLVASGLKSVIGNSNRKERKVAIDEAVAKAKESLGEDSEALDEVKPVISALNKKLIREHIVSTSSRVDGRKTDQLRDLSAYVGTLELAHGSGLFQRGETQVLNATTLATQRMDQIVDGLEPSEKKRFMHHYNFPPFSTGETGFMRGPKRREIGHGALAEKAISGVLPSFEDFPYTIRLVSEVLSSNGSTSMASVCASSLSLMDAGVPISSAVAGIAMGLIYEDGQYIPLTDILGEEDAYGDMDFKVAGTSDTVTALQLDTKIDGIPSEVLVSALEQAKTARLEILSTMEAAISAPRDDIKDTAPKITSFEIPMDKVGEVIGPKGKVINGIQEKTGADVSIDDAEGVAIVTLASTSRAAIDEAQAEIDLILNPPTAEMGQTYTGEVVNITDFGAFVNILPGTDGLVHISKLGGGKRVDRVEDEVSLGDTLTVVVDDIEKTNRGDRVSLSLEGAPVSNSGGDRRSQDRRGSGGGRNQGRQNNQRNRNNRSNNRQNNRQSDRRNNNRNNNRNNREASDNIDNSDRVENRENNDNIEKNNNIEEVSFEDTFSLED